MTKVILQNTSGGIVNDPRDTALGVARVVTNFDINTSPTRLIPYRSSESGDTAPSTSKKQNFCIALRTGTTYRLYALGVKSGAATAEILMKDLTVGTTDLGDGGWLTPANNQSSGGSANFNLFIYYKKMGLIYSAAGGTTIETFDPTSVAAFNSASQALAYTNIAQGLIHSQDDILYVPYDNKIASNNNGSWTTAALTLPSQYYITSICENGKFIDIAAAPLSGVEGSRLFRWNRSSTLATLDENVSWGAGNFKIVEELGGYTVGISLDGSNSTRFNDRVTFKYFTGAGAVSFFEILGTTGTILPIAKQKINNRLYFMMSITLNGVVREGVWSFGKNSNGVFNLVHERTPNNDTFIVNGTLNGFIYVNDFLFISYQTNSAFALSKTDDTATYSSTSIIETVINPGMALADKPKLKQLKFFCIGYKSAASGQIVVKAKVDGGSNVTIITATTTGVNVIEMPLAGFALDKGREFEFREESTLGAEIIYSDYDYEVIPSLA